MRIALLPRRRLKRYLEGWKTLLPSWTRGFSSWWQHRPKVGLSSKNWNFLKKGRVKAQILPRWPSSSTKKLERKKRKSMTKSPMLGPGTKKVLCPDTCMLLSGIRCNPTSLNPAASVSSISPFLLQLCGIVSEGLSLLADPDATTVV